MVQVTLTEARARLKTLIETALTGETVLIVGEDRQTVQLVPVQPERHQRKAGSAQGLIWMADDFDAPSDDFKEYME